MKIYFYHRRPDNMRSNILYPLNQLKDIYPDIYEKQVAKYMGREHLLDVNIPFLNCLWNDVLHLSPVHPKDMDEAWRENGFNYELEFFEIDLDDLDRSNLVIYKYEELKINRTDERDIIPFSEEYVLGNNKVRQITKEYFKKCQEEGTKPLLFVGVPHILYKGSIDVSKSKIIKI